MQQGYFRWWLLQCLGMIAADRSKEDDVDYFGRLPDDIIIDIFGRVNDCKFLTQCLLLSKRIASLIRLVCSIFIKIHLTRIEDNYPAATREYCFNSLGFLRFKLIRSTYNNLTSTSQDIQFQSWWKFRMNTNSFFIRKAREVLRPFSEVKSAIVEYLSKFDLFSFCVPINTVRWMVEYSGCPVNTGIIKSCAFQGPIMTILDSRNIMTLISWFISDLHGFAFTFYPMVVQMVQDHESLRDILVISTDSRKGWIHAREDEIVKMRQSSAGVSSTDKLMNTIREEGMNIKMKVKVWYDVSVLNPPGDSSSVYAFVVVSSSYNTDREVKTVTSRFWGDCNYWEGHRDDKTINMRELVETRPCNLEFTWIASYIVNNLP